MPDGALVRQTMKRSRRQEQYLANYSYRWKVAGLLISCGLFLSVRSSAQAVPPLDDEYREAAGRLIGAAMVDMAGWEKLTYLTTTVGHRLSGTPALDRAVEWVAQQMRSDGLENVRTQPVKVPRWSRGAESARIVSPVQRPLGMLGLGGSIGTPKHGIVASVVVVGSFDELDRLGTDTVRGKIVLFDMPWQSYNETVRYRRNGASQAAKRGAVASLVRSVTPRSLYTPHTGAMNYDTSAPLIPAAAITVEDAAWIRRATRMGEDVRVHLTMEAATGPDADSANVIGEIVGRELPDEIVVLGGHIDSWDVGQGAHDDGVGILSAWQAVTLMKRLGLKPRRTIRVVAWTNEENGGRGSAAYRASLGTDVGKHVAAIEMDSGAERPLGFGFAIRGLPDTDARVVNAVRVLREIARLLEAIGTNTIGPGGGGADIEPLMVDGVPGLGLQTVGEHYFDWHHTNADTLDKVDLQDFRRCMATMAVMAYVLADMPGRL
ncbi:MAG TPA: M20/M25/M40 family metallo-hydrolase [Vicinamibacterales bacterium]|nr:M20/M25/M40 family metallo-hydrolase [Vicinamibacterales bacterium]